MMLSVKVVPKSSRSRVVGWLADELKLCVAAPPEQGKANRAVEELLAAVLALPRGGVRVVSGQSNSRKQVEVVGLDEPEVRRRLERHLSPDL